MTYLIMPRTAIKIMKPSDILSAVQGDVEVDEEGNVNTDINMDDYMNDDGSVKDSAELGGVYKPLLQNIKLKQLVFLPKLSPYIKLDYLKDLQEKYPDDWQSKVDFRFDLSTMTLGLNGASETIEDEFVVTPMYRIKCEGEMVYSDKTKIQTLPASSGIDFMPDAYYKENPDDEDEIPYSIHIDSTYDSTCDAASFDLTECFPEGKKFADYNGVAITKTVGVGLLEVEVINDEFFVVDGAENYLRVVKAATVSNEDDDSLASSIYSVSYDDNGNFVFYFNGGDNFFQVDFMYIDINAKDIYNNMETKTIPTQAIDLVLLELCP